MNSVFDKPVEAEVQELAEGIAIVINGDTAPKAIARGQFLYIKNNSTLPSGGYTATAAIASGDTISSSNVTIDPDGIVNALNSKLSDLITVKEYTSLSFQANPTVANETLNVYKKMATVDLTTDIASYGNPISVCARGYGGIPMPTSLTFSNNTWRALVLGTENTSSGNLFVTFSKQVTNI